MIPRTTIDEANKHIMGLHKKVHELETIVEEQREALLSKDDVLKEKTTELSFAKEMEIGLLQEKLHSKERTVTILQEQMSQKNQQIVVLQRNFRIFKKVLSFKPDLSELLISMNDAETCSKNSMDWIDEEFFDDEKSVEGDSGMGTSIQFFSNHNGSNFHVDDTESQVYNSPGKQPHKNSKGREFYL